MVKLETIAKPWDDLGNICVGDVSLIPKTMRLCVTITERSPDAHCTTKGHGRFKVD